MSTIKNRIPFLNDSIRSQVIEHIKENANKKDIYIDEINGYKEHIHCLVSMGPDKSLEEIAKLLKGESSYWINKNNLTSQKFTWQNEYWVAGVGKSELNRVRKYIRNQEEHHKKVSFEEELEEFLKEFALKPGFY
jgi:REP element-mobilizing transposase RayT